MRFFRLIMGMVFIFQGWEVWSWWIMGIGIVFVVLSLLNVNTCSTSACTVNRRSRAEKKDLDNVTFEELK